MKYIIVTGGVISGLGKGISISSIGVLLKSAGLRVTSIKIDPYLNTDAGTMSPFEHGEVFVLQDGGEGDLDLGNYERFLDITLTHEHNITTGKVYSQVINAERRGDYLGKTVQVIPHVTDAIQDHIDRVSRYSVDGSGEMADVCLVEVGGTVGDIESLVFLEALRQFTSRVGRENITFVHVSLVPVMGVVGEQKTKPTQHSVKELRSVGISPDFLICRSTSELDQGTKEKLALFCQVPPTNVFSVYDVSNIYHVPLIMHEQGMSHALLDRLNLQQAKTPKLRSWKSLAYRVDALSKEREVTIALVGKYNGLSDSYLSIIKALKHAALWTKHKLVLRWIDASGLENSKDVDEATKKECWSTLQSVDGILVPGGFGSRGVEGKIQAIQYAREHKIPFLGICLGMQCAVIEYARNVAGMSGANSTEFDSSTNEPVIIFMPEINPSQMGGTMRLGARPTILRARHDGKASLASQLYGDHRTIIERHRHRYEVNPDIVPTLQSKGIHFVGTDERQQRMEIIELDQEIHPFFLGVQYHPEFLSHPYRPSPPFLGLLYASTGQIKSALPLKEASRALANFANSASLMIPIDEHIFDVNSMTIDEDEKDNLPIDATSASEQITSKPTNYQDIDRPASPVQPISGPMSSKLWSTKSHSTTPSPQRIHTATTKDMNKSLDHQPSERSNDMLHEKRSKNTSGERSQDTLVKDTSSMRKVSHPIPSSATVEENTVSSRAAKTALSISTRKISHSSTGYVNSPSVKSIQYGSSHETYSSNDENLK